MDDNPYEVLHVDSATPEVIEAVAEALAKRYGPDGTNLDESMVARIDVAQSKLCDPVELAVIDTRRAADAVARSLATTASANGAAMAPAGGSGVNTMSGLPDLIAILCL